MRKYILSVFLLSMIAILPVFAQRELQNPLLDSKKILEQGIKLAEDGKYKEALTEYLKVPASDTAYSAVLHQIIVACYNDSNYVTAEKYAMTALDLYPTQHTEWYELLANIYDDTKRADLAFRAYDTILVQDHYNSRVLFNKGITFYRQSKYEEATACFQRCVI